MYYKHNITIVDYSIFGVKKIIIKKKVVRYFAIIINNSFHFANTHFTDIILKGVNALMFLNYCYSSVPYLRTYAYIPFICVFVRWRVIQTDVRLDCINALMFNFFR